VTRRTRLQEESEGDDPKKDNPSPKIHAPLAATELSVDDLDQVAGGVPSISPSSVKIDKSTDTELLKGSS